MRRNHKLLAALALTLALCLLPATMLAAEYNVANGDVTVKREGGKQYVQQGAGDAVEDEAPVLTGYTVTNVIKLISVDEGGTVNVTLHGLAMWTKGSPIEIGDNEHVTNAVINLEGMNELYTRENESDASLIRIASGNLTITSENGGKLVAQITNNGYGAAIGSNADEDCNANIRITGNADVDTFAYASACIGSGYRGDFAGRIVIDGNAKLKGHNNGVSNYLAVLGSGLEGAFTGSIEIKDNAEVMLNNYSANTLGQSDSPDAADAAGSVTLDGNAKIMVLSNQNSHLYLGGCESVPGVQVKIGDGVQFLAFDLETGEYTIPIAVDDELIHINGTLIEEPEEPAEVNYAQGEAFRVVDKDGNDVAYEEILEDGILTIKAAKGAKLIGALEDMQRLYNEGATELRFGSSVLPIAELYHGVGMQCDTVVLT
ncbi:MAG: hypothetical protein ACI4XW_03835, partial [Candidatus Spyradocola sp.]